MENRNDVHAVLMVSPDTFSFNPQTAQSNSFSSYSDGQLDNLQATVKHEFSGMISTLIGHDIQVLEMQSPIECLVPDAVFPNNWFSLHLNRDSKRILTLYPMESPNRRLERQIDNLLEKLTHQHYPVDEVVDLTHYEEQGKFLESTGSMVIDHKAGIIYACFSSRTHPELVEKVASDWGYQAILFNAYHKNQSIYHTNVLMSLGSNRAILCSDVIDESHQRHVMSALEKSGKDIVNVSVSQLTDMCCNVLEVLDVHRNKKLVMSQRAYEAFTSEQLAKLSMGTELVVCDIATIEKVSGGSARCMLAEVR